MARKSEGDLDLMTKRKKAVERFSRAFNCPSECTEHGLVSTVEIPGWTYGDFAGNGKLAIWRMAKTFEVHRLLQEKNSKRSDHYSKDENVRFVISTTVLNYSRRLQSEAAIIWPMVLKSMPDYIKDSSIQFVNTVKAKDSGELLALSYFRGVFTDPQTGKKSPIPASLAIHRHRFPGDEIMDQTVTIPPIPEKATYYRFCMDAAAEAWRAGALTFDPDERDVRRTEARHLGETFGGDDLTVCLWSEAEGREPRLHYVIKKGESRVFCCNIVFYPQLDTAKL